MLLNPYDAPGVAGASLADAVTDDGRPLLGALAETADAGGGWVSTRFANRRHDLVERKHLYVLPHDGIVFVSGYHDSATGSISWSPPRTSSAPSWQGCCSPAARTRPSNCGTARTTCQLKRFASGCEAFGGTLVGVCDEIGVRQTPPDHPRHGRLYARSLTPSAAPSPANPCSTPNVNQL